MTATLFELQEQQFNHDQRCHRDILYMSYQERFKHIAMHYGKYSGRLATILKANRIDIDAEKQISKTLVDCFIIVLNSGELFQLNLESQLKTRLGVDRALSFTELSELLIESSPEMYSYLNK